MILLGLAAVLLLLIILFGFYSMSSGEEKDQNVVASQEDVLKKQGLEKIENVDPKPLDPPPPVPQVPQFEQVPIKEETKPESADKFEEIVRQIKEKEAALNVDKKDLPAPPESKPEVAPSVPAPQPVVATPPVAPKAKSENVNDVPKGVYVQVGSFSTLNPDKRFLDSIEKNGYSYKILKSDGGSKVLIGPFGNKTEAANKITDIRNKIAKGAFVKNI